MGSIVCESRLAELGPTIQSLRQLDEVIDCLVREIPDPAEQQRFLMNLTRRLSRL